MSNHSQTQTENKAFSFVWNGGFSYLTYLKKTCHIDIAEEHLNVQSRSYILGVFATQPKNEQWPLASIRSVQTGLKINWFDLVFAILFAIVGLAAIKFWPLILTAFFLLRCFNTSISITDQQNKKLTILSNSKSAANLFVDKLAQLINQRENAIQIGEKQVAEARAQIYPIKTSNKLKLVGLIASAAVVALLVLTISILSRGGFEDTYVQWVKNGAIPGSDLKMVQVLENPAFFSNVQWKEVQEEGNTLDRFVMYQATLSDQGVKVAVRTVFQVFGENHFEAVETSTDGDTLPTSDWYVFLADMTNRYENKTTAQAISEVKETEQAVASLPIQPTSTTEIAAVQPNNETTASPIDEMNLSNFTKWNPSEPDITLPLELDGEAVELLIGRDSPNGVKLVALSTSLKQGWPLVLQTNANEGTPFDDFGDLREGFSLYVQAHDFGNDGVPEVVIAASDNLLETYVWVFSYNFVFTESETAPLDLIWFSEAQSDVVLNNDRILLPFGSQGLFDEYVYSDNAFIKQ
ncbi:MULTISPECIES: hypothetical protein [unclassified Paenibacillus]|uniref:hypothetical protein n=1 Tax=unclassified Paenibacillus TaxID=185978 RepID=UPI002475F3F7|nr:MULTISPECIES: hypothetical protein [unclassified Paenibacillus]MDH6429053.1 hypothetical protein [Paenibacillus sp. PastH-4]MDH6445258.1 hypothetical protein [Paenibacillus sp. PastF-4]MDH6529148.1 hypothetical protein [Paenibacillus sp. PastH-3]